jgi:hypothetical protein
MKITQEYCDDILSKIDTDDFDNLFNEFLKNISTHFSHLIDKPEFIFVSEIKQIKLMYYVLLNTYGCDQMLKELESPDIEEEEKKEMKEFIDNLQYIYNNVDRNINNLQDDDILTADKVFDEEINKKSREVADFIKKMIQDEIELKNTMKQMNEKLELLSQSLKSLNGNFNDLKKQL